MTAVRPIVPPTGTAAALCSIDAENVGVVVLGFVTAVA
jgi:hypothetical protein